jgi:CRISPR-associated protein Csy1
VREENFDAVVAAAIDQARAALARKDFGAAFACAGDALRHEPDSTEARLIRANAALQLARWPDAIGDLDWLIAQTSAQPKLLRNLALCWLHIGNEKSAARDYPAAVDAYRRANVADPQDNRVLLKLAAACSAMGDDDRALLALTVVAERAVDPQDLRSCATLLVEAGALAAAHALSNRLLSASDEVSWSLGFSRQLRECGDLQGSRDLLSLLREHSVDPIDRLRIDIATALGLPATYASGQALSAARADYAARLDQLVDSYPAARVAEITPPVDALAWDNFYLAYQGGNDRELQARFGDWFSESLHAVIAEPFAPRRASVRSRPRIAFVSSRLHECTVGSYFASWIEYLASNGWEVVLAHIGDTRDQLSRRLAACAQSELNLAADVRADAMKLAELDADLLLYPELGMDHRVLSLAALRLAPHQACAWGHPVTSGLPTIDSFVSCAAMEPDQAQDHYRERLLLLPGMGTRYLSPQVPEPVPRAALRLPTRGTLYLVPQSLYKLHPDNDDVFVQVLSLDADAVLVFFGGALTGALRAFRARLRARFDAIGADFEKRVVFLPLCSRADYLRINLACDVMLDAVHWSGGNTTLDALHCGLPVVTCAGQFMRGRQSYGMLTALDCADLIADSPQRLAALATQVANDPIRRQKFAEYMRSHLAAFTGSDEPLRALDALLRHEIG